MRFYGRSLRWFLPILLILSTAAQMAAQNGEGVRESVSSLRPELLEDSKALAAVLNECKRHSGTMVGHAVGDLQKHLGKEMTPRELGDISTMLRIADDCTGYLSSPDLVSGMNLPAAQEARREANNTLQKLDEISRKAGGNDLLSLEAHTREHLQSPTSLQLPNLSVWQAPASAASTSSTVQPLAVYQRASNAPDLPGRMSPEEVQVMIMEASQEATLDTDHFLSEAASTVSADLLALHNATMRYPNFTSHPLMQSIAALKHQLGKSLHPKNVSDVETITDLLSRTLPIFGGSQVAYGHVDKEREAIDNYKARQSAISSVANTIVDIERTLDRGDLIAADKQYQQVAADSFTSQFTTTQRYLAETSVLRKELAANREAAQVPRVRPGQQPYEQVLTLANEVAKLETSRGTRLAADLLTNSVQQDKVVVAARLESLPAFAFNPNLYKVSPINNESTAHEAAARLEDVSQRLSFASDLTGILSRQDAMSTVRVLFGESTEADLRHKGASIPSAQQVAASLSNAIQGYQRAVQEAETRRQAEYAQRAAAEEARSAARLKAKDRAANSTCYDLEPILRRYGAVSPQIRMHSALDFRHTMAKDLGSNVDATAGGGDKQYLLFTSTPNYERLLQLMADKMIASEQIRVGLCAAGFAEVQFLIRSADGTQRLIKSYRTSRSDLDKLLTK